MSEWKTFDEHPSNPDSDVFVTDFETVQVRNWIQAELFSGFAKSNMRWMEIDVPEVPCIEDWPDIKREDPDYKEGQCSVWDCLGHHDRLEIAAFIFRKITHSPCSFRRLIYNRLGFDTSAYAPLYDAGGLEITNAMTYEDSSLS